MGAQSPIAARRNETAVAQRSPVHCQASRPCAARRQRPHSAGPDARSKAGPVKKGKDIIVEGYEYKGLDVIETGFAIRYTLLHKGGRQIINTLLPGDIVGFPASFFDHAIFSVMAVTKMSLHHIQSEAFVELCEPETENRNCGHLVHGA